MNKPSSSRWRACWPGRGGLPGQRGCWRREDWSLEVDYLETDDSLGFVAVDGGSGVIGASIRELHHDRESQEGALSHAERSLGRSADDQLRLELNEGVIVVVFDRHPNAELLICVIPVDKEADSKREAREGWWQCLRPCGRGSANEGEPGPQGVQLAVGRHLGSVTEDQEVYFGRQSRALNVCWYEYGRILAHEERLCG